MDYRSYMVFFECFLEAVMCAAYQDEVLVMQQISYSVSV